MKHLIITTVGTSIFTNYQKKEVEMAWEDADNYRGISDYRKLEAKNDSASQYSTSDYKKAEDKIEQFWLQGIKKVGEAWIVSKNTPNRHASAEITSILEIAKKIRNEDVNAEIEVQLLATDTALSVSAAKLIGLFFENSDMVSVREFVKETDFVASLGVKPKSGDIANAYYDAGLQNLVDKLMGEGGIIKKAKKNEFNPVINFSGGYKSTIPVLTIIAQLEGIPMYYIYEDSDHLMEVGNLPFSFDWGIMEYLHPFLDNALIKDSLQFNAAGLNDKTLRSLLSNKLIVNKGDAYELSPMGNILLTYFREQSSSKPSIFGEYIEKKLFQFYVEKYRDKKDLPQEGGTLSSLPFHGVPYKVGSDSGDFDLVLEKTVDGINYFIACEVKSISNIRDKEDDKKKLKGQFRKYATCFSDTFNGKKLSEIRLIIHLLPYQKQYIYLELMNEFEEYVKKELDLKFSVFLVEVKTDKNGYINYHESLKQPLEDGKLKRILPC